jgi:hypothetical protein
MSIDSELIKQAQREAFAQLSRQRGYEVQLGAHVCAFIAPLMSAWLQSCNVEAQVNKQLLTNGTCNWSLLLHDEDRMIGVDATWWSMLDNDECADMPEVITINEGIVQGLDGEVIPAVIVAGYLSQFA